MNNNGRGIMTSLITMSAAGAAIYGITRGVQNGTFQRLPQSISNAMNNPTVQQMTKPLQNMTNNLQDETNDIQQQRGIRIF
ncbi:hypothetical protein [Oceanobacillus jordanicus]|uniref:YtxH domain-containing protein n=1 Tax=Oceanobacillus jordanicus TaxID=2867266 RepID=A0AAW5B7R4_9BACI|nr:hypothetical protein [Oceanobacillus jordanicus]MCG3420050.1 hypothetical protein [Oceanobacillus jordanicus]